MRVDFVPRRAGKRLIIASLASFAAVSLFCGFGSAPAAPPAGGSVPRFKKVVVVILENENADAALKQKFLNELTQRGAYLSNYHGIGHPSQPNYIALISGDPQGVTSDNNTDISASNVTDLLETKGLTWKAYAEQFPGDCYLGAQSGTYARKHVPFLSFKNIQTNPKRCAQIVGGAQFDEDLRNGTLPNFSFYVPDMNHDGHDTGVAVADQWLESRFGALVNDPVFMQDTLLIVTFDESGVFSFSNGIYAVLVGDAVGKGRKSNVSYNHYSLLRTIEEGFGVGNLGRNDQKASAITDIWN